MIKSIQSLLLILSFIHLSYSSYAQDGASLNIITGANTSYVEVYNAASLYNLTTGTVSFWCQITDLSTSALLFSTTNKGTSGVNNNEFYISYRYGLNSIQVVGVTNGTVILDANTPKNSLSDNKWHNITVVADGIGSIQVYIDGEISALTAGTCCGGTTNDFFFANAGTLNNMKIGTIERNTKLPGGSFLMDDFKILKGALSQCQVKEYMSSPSNSSNLFVYYTFEQLQNLGAGIAGTNDIKDITGNNYDGDVINADLSGIMASPYLPPAYNLTIASPEYVEIYNAAPLYNLTTGTVSFWCKITDLSKQALLFSTTNKGIARVNNNEFYITFRNGMNSIQVTGVMDGTVMLDANTPNNSITDNEWHNITVVADGIGAVQVYIDGTLSTLSAGTCCGGTTNDFFFANAGMLNNMKIGTIERDTKLPGGNFLMADFKIWSTALNQDQINNAINSKSVILPQCNLELYYDFTMLENLSVGIAGTNDYRDKTSNGYDGDFITSVATSIISHNTDVSVSVYPNPSTGIFTVLLPDKNPVDMVLLNSIGKILVKETAIDNQYTFSDPNLSPGIYILKITSSDGKQTSIKICID